MRLSTPHVRHAVALASANAGLWAVGNGLVSTTLVFYLAADLGATGFGSELHPSRSAFCRAAAAGRAGDGSIT
ncbi:MAG: hypothetical protein U0805_08860 [Pirellulales bacterium]